MNGDNYSRLKDPLLYFPPLPPRPPPRGAVEPELEPEFPLKLPPRGLNLYEAPLAGIVKGCLRCLLSLKVLQTFSKPPPNRNSVVGFNLNRQENLILNI